MGEFQILNDHAPIVSTLSSGLVTITKPGGELTHLSIEGGIVEVRKNEIILLIEGLREGK